MLMPGQRDGALGSAVGQHPQPVALGVGLRQRQVLDLAVMLQPCNASAMSASVARPRMRFELQHGSRPREYDQSPRDRGFHHRARSSAHPHAEQIWIPACARMTSSLSFPRKREPRILDHFWIPACAWMTVTESHVPQPAGAGPQKTRRRRGSSGESASNWRRFHPAQSSPFSAGPLRLRVSAVQP